MKKKNLSNFIRLTYLKLIRTNDSAQKIALGFGLGVFLGVIPGTGILAALFLAFIFRLNRLSALLGSLLTNTWISIVTFLLSIKVGSAIMKLNWQEVYAKLASALKGFKFLDLLNLSFIEIILPLVLGYFIISLILGIIAYLVILITIRMIRNENKSRINFSK
jgi:uncharacterized protein (DUF2062 family)